MSTRCKSSGQIANSFYALSPNPDLSFIGNIDLLGHNTKSPLVFSR